MPIVVTKRVTGSAVRRSATLENFGGPVATYSANSPVLIKAESPVNSISVLFAWFVVGAALFSFGCSSIAASPMNSLADFSCDSSDVSKTGSASCNVDLTRMVPGRAAIQVIGSNAVVSAPTSVVAPDHSTSIGSRAWVWSASAAGSEDLIASHNSGSQIAHPTTTASSNIATIAGVSCNSTALSSPGADSCSLSISRAAPSTGLGIALTTSSTGVSVPAWVVVPAGGTSTAFTVNVASGIPTEAVALSATYQGLSTTLQLQVGSTPPVITVALSPGSGSVQTNSSQHFAASVSGTSNTAVTWSVNGSGCSGSACGTITSAGLYTAPSAVPSPASVQVKATSQKDTTKSATATVTITAAQGTTYYIAPASAGGNDRNDGLSANAPWLTPNHSANCGDLLLAAPGSYNADNFTVGNWGTVSCPLANNVAWLKCGTFDTCRISTNSLSSGIWIDRSFWGLQGWEVTTQKGSGEPTCFIVAPNWSNPVEVHHVILANNIANGCQSGGFSSANHPGEVIGVDYLVLVGNIAYNSTQGQGQCFTGISVYAPVESDSLPGTHIYLTGNIAWDNWDPNYCAGGVATDGEGMMFDEVDASNQGFSKQYAGQLVADNNILIGNGGPGLQVDHNNAGSGPWATIYTRHNTLWGNNHDMTLAGFSHGEMLWGAVRNSHSTYDLAVTNLQYGGGGGPDAAFYVGDSPTSTNSVSNSWGYSPWGNNSETIGSSGFSFASTNVFGVNPQLANPTVPGAPSCSGYANVTACMATTIANFTPNNSSAKAYGYQRPGSTPVKDSLFPQWLCTVNNFPAGLVTMGCAN
jgi:hypothetical protein